MLQLAIMTKDKTIQTRKKQRPDLQNKKHKSNIKD